MPQALARALALRSPEGRSVDDAVFAAAWVIVLDRFLGAGGPIALNELAAARGGRAVRRSLHRVARDEIRARWMEEFEAQRISRDWVEEGADGEEADQAWVAGGLEGFADDRPETLLVGLEGDGERRLSARFSPAAHAPDVVGALLECTVRVAGELVDRPGEPVGSIDPLGRDQRKLLMEDLNPPAPILAPELSIDSMFRMRARALPGKTALSWNGGAMTYAELDRRSDGAARALAAAGVAAGSVVGVALERSPQAIAAILGILKAGAAYLPLDLRYPAERISFLLADARAKVVIATPGDGTLLPADAVAVDPGAFDSPDGSEPRVRTDGETLAYVMYTSGSTGEPKGIEIRHRSVIRLVHEVDFVRLDERETVLHAAPLGFDASTFEIWGPLLNGGTCVLHDEAVPTGKGLSRSISGQGVTTAWLTSSLFNAVVDDDPAFLAGLGQLLIGGEALSVFHVRRALDALPGMTLVNGYGPTECTTFACTYRIPHDVDPSAGPVPIGRPISRTTAYVLGPRLEPLPLGMVGELCVGGEGLARGYLRRPELTSERFVQSPFGGPGERLYRTGDLARMRGDGVIEFVGRRDTQVKIRGYRIELGEIETALSRHPDVRACAVVARDDLPGGTRLVAYVVPREPQAPVAGFRAHLALLLPDFMIPASFVEMAALPVTANGKLDRRALPRPGPQRPELANPYAAPAGESEELLCRVFAEVLGLDRVGRLDNFFELGGSSLLVLQAVARLQEETRREIAPTLFFRDPTPASLAALLDARETDSIPASRFASARRERDAREPVAIIAMAGRFPGAESVEALWENLVAGKEGITFFGAEELDPSIPAQARQDPAYVKARGVLAGIDRFDAGFFGIPPKEADVMDPQQRIFLELCWECLERGGYVPDACPGPVGVFAGMHNATYLRHHVSAHPDVVRRVGEFQVMLGNEKDYVATRAAHRLNLSGPAVSMNTACSTSLVAVAQAVASLRNAQCDMAIAGGVSITCPPRSGYLYEEGSMLSPDGHTRSFDADAQGTVFSDGAAVVLLKRLGDALADGDTIFAVVRGVAVNNDGGAKASFTAPSVDGQAAVIASALADAGVEARSIGYVETHGTATPLGDPVEIEALSKAFRRQTPDAGFCRIGSVKSNVGHTVIAAGATGLIKAALCLANERIPASINFRAPNAGLGIAGSPFVVNDRLADWPRGDTVRRAGVSSFGVGGTNAHVILEEAPARREAHASTGPKLLQVSARSADALAKSTERLAAHLEASPATDLADVAHTLRAGRKAFAVRACVVAEEAAGAVVALRDPNHAWRASATAAPKSPAVAFLFPGQGSQYASMGRALHESLPAFREAFDECAAALEGVVDFDLRARVFGDDGQALVATATTQPALFCIEYALARHWLGLGLRPAALIGHSVGEFVAAAVAGVMSAESAARLVARRGQLMQAMAPGAMLAVRAPASAVHPRLPEALSLAAENSPGLCVVAGPADAIESFRLEMDADGVGARALVTSHAFHSAMMDPAVAPFEEEVGRIRLAAPSIPIFSTATGRLLTQEQARDPAYWAMHLRQPVRFSTAFVALLETAPDLLLEVGPRATLATLARQHAARDRAVPPAVASLADDVDSERQAVLLAAGRLWTLGVDFPAGALDRGTSARRVRLPTYPFERERHWLDAAPAGASPAVAPAGAADFAPQPPAVSGRPQETEMTTREFPGGNRESRLPAVLEQVRAILEDISGIDMADADPAVPLVELGFDSLSLTQIAIQLKQTFKVGISFRQIMEKHRSLGALAAHLDREMPAAPAPAAAPVTPAPVTGPGAPALEGVAMPSTLIEQVIRQQMQLMAQQIELLKSGGASSAPAAPAEASRPEAPRAVPEDRAPAVPAEEEAPKGSSRYDVKKAFGAIARIHTDTTEITDRQRARLDAFIRRYVARTLQSKEYTQRHRPHMADPRVVNGFRPMLKEIIYQIVVGRSKGAHVWDLDGNQYVDVLNGFGMNLFGWQPGFVLEAVRQQMDLGYEIGPQHPLAGEVARLICELTGFDRAGLCNTGSEAVMGAVRIARTVTGRNTIVLFTGSYHGIFDEVIVRATKKLRAVPAAPGILPNTSQNVLVLDYGTPEALEIIRSRADELAAVLVEPVQSRRPDFQPREFLQEVRKVTAEAGALLILDEVVTGFRCHPGGIQALFGIRADLCTYGKVVGGGFPIGIIAGKREYMDALDGGQWSFGDDSIPTVGVTYFAGTFVRHPLALAAGKAVLEHLKRSGPELQEGLTRTTAAMVDELNAFCREAGAPIVLRSFASVWKVFFTEEHPLQDLLFAMMRSRGVHILDNFPCFFTTAHTAADVAIIKTAFKESVRELQESDFLPRNATGGADGGFDAAKPPVPGARIGKDRDGRPAWFVPNPDIPGKFLKLDA